MADDDVKKDIPEEAGEEQENQEDQLEEPNEFEKGEAKKKKLTYIIVFVVQIILAFVLIKFVVFPWYYNDSTEEEVEEVQEETEDSEPKDIGHIYKISNLTVNPSGSRGRRFAVFEMAISVQTVEFVEELKKYDAVIKDNFIQYLRSKTVEDLSADTIAVTLKADLLDIAGDIVGHEELNDIYFTRFILQ